MRTIHTCWYFCEHVVQQARVYVCNHIVAYRLKLDAFVYMIKIYGNHYQL